MAEFLIWKHDVAAGLQAQGFTISPDELADAHDVEDTLKEHLAWWRGLDDRTRAVLTGAGSAAVVAGLQHAGFASRWPGFLTLLGQDMGFGIEETVGRVLAGVNVVRRDTAMAEEMSAGDGLVDPHATADETIPAGDIDS